MTQFAIFQSIKTQKKFYIDLHKIRLQKLRTKLFLWATIIQEQQKIEPLSLVMVGLTYRPGEVPKPLDISNYLKKVSRQAKSRLKGFAWVAEVQPSRGILHYHVVFAVTPTFYLEFPDMGQWIHGNSNIVRARTPFY